MQQLGKDPAKSFYFFMSGENPDLAAYEFTTLLTAINSATALDYEVKFSSDNRIATLKIRQGVEELVDIFLLRIMKRVTMVHFCCRQCFQINFSVEEDINISTIVEYINSDFILNLDPMKSFGIAIKIIGDINETVKAEEINQKLCVYLGKKIQEVHKEKPVNLNAPEEQYIGVITKSGFWFGILFKKSQRKEVRKRSAHKRPFFHPSSMNPILQRTMINLAGLKEDEWLLDPFCGTGGSLIEASRLGMKTIGIEIDRKILWGAYQNISEDVNRSHIHLILGDALNLCIEKGSIAAIVTDPPYGTAASTKGFSVETLLIKFFYQVADILKPGTRVVIAVPSNVKIEDQVSVILKASYKRFYQFVHRSLTRKILVFTKH
ncbi:MAG: TRM11 family SAM-dependent methyltransferase [Candidatus Hodarchaeales archaeon]